MISDILLSYFSPSIDQKLFDAIENGDHVAAILAILDAKSVDINLADSHRNSLLHMAVLHRREDLVVALIERGVNVNACNIDNETPLHWAARKGFHSLSVKLIDRGADLHASNTLGFTPLHMASSKGHLWLAVALVERGADITAVNVCWLGRLVAYQVSVACNESLDRV
jgi:ankyrin repeat protein